MHARVNILGVGVSAIQLNDAIRTIEEWIHQKDHQYVCVRDVHGVMECQRDEALRRIHNNAGMVTPDGMPLVWISRLKGYSHVRRVYGPDLMLALCHNSLIHGFKHFFYGGAEGVAERLRDSLTFRFPGLKVVGVHTPPFRPLTPSEDEKVITKINATQADIVWVGLSTPKQEHWMAEHVGRLSAPVLIGVGAAFDFHAGTKPQAPRWIQQSGLEWCFRLMTEPRRLWRRYLINNPVFVVLVCAQLLGLKRYSIE